jgi:hypothetical protein
MSERRPQPDLDRVRDAMREHDRTREEEPPPPNREDDDAREDEQDDDD